MTATVDKFGRIVIPKRLRDRLGLKPGSEVEMTECAGHIELTPAHDGSGIEMADDGHLVLTGEWPADWPADFDAVGWMREQRMRQIMGLEEG